MTALIRRSVSTSCHHVPAAVTMDAATGTVTWTTASTCCLQSPARTAAGRAASSGVKKRTRRNVSMITANIFFQNVQAVVNQAIVTMCMSIESVISMLTAKQSALSVAEVHMVALGPELIPLMLRNAIVRSADISAPHLLHVPAAVGGAAALSAATLTADQSAPVQWDLALGLEKNELRDFKQLNLIFVT